MSRSLATRMLAGLIVLTVVGSGGWAWYRSTRPDARLQRGRKAIQRGDYLTANQYALLLERRGANDQAYLLKAELAVRQHAYDAALDYSERVSDGPLRIDATIIAAQCLTALKRPREAEAALFYVLSRHRDHIDAHRWLAIIYFNQGATSLAIPHLERVAELDPTDGRPHRTLGLIYKNLDEQDKAILAYEESLRRDPKPRDLDEVRLEFGECLLQQFREADAVRMLEGLEAPQAIATRAEAMLRLGQSDEAVEILDAALLRHPDDGALLRLRGERYLDAGQPAKAAEMLEKVVRILGQDPRTRNKLGLAYSRLQRSADAEIQNRKVQEIQDLIKEVYEKEREAERNPWDPRPRRELARLSDQMGRPKLAQMWRAAAEACRHNVP